MKSSEITVITEEGKLAHTTTSDYSDKFRLLKLSKLIPFQDHGSWISRGTGN